VQLEVSRREFWRRSLSCAMEPPLGAPDGVQFGGVDQTEYHREHGVPRQRPRRDLFWAERRQRSSGIRDSRLRAADPSGGREPPGPRSALVNPFVGTMFPNFSMLRATSPTFRVWHPRGPEKPRSGRGFTPTKRRRHMSRKRSDWPASGALARPAPSSRTTWTIGRSARALAAAWCRGGLC
jgi:hypothetical protein